MAMVLGLLLREVEDLLDAGPLRSGRGVGFRKAPPAISHSCRSGDVGTGQNRLWRSGCDHWLRLRSSVGQWSTLRCCRFCWEWPRGVGACEAEE